MRRASRHAILTAPFLAILVAANDASAQQPACTTPKTHCGGNDGYYASAEDLQRVTAVVDPLLKELRACLDAAGGKHVQPAVMMRWDSEGAAVSVKVDVPGYDSLPCVAKVSGKLSQLQNPHETAIRCDYGCGKPPAPAPAPPPVAPVPVPPPAATTAPPPAPPPPTKTPERPPVHYEKAWYGWQTIIADGASIGVGVAGGAAKSGGLVAAGIISFVLATPIVHMVHGNIGPGFGSLGIRLLLPLVGLGVGALAGVIVAADQDNTFNKAGDTIETAAWIGFLVGVGGCVVIDAAGFAWTKEKVEGPANALGPRPLGPRPIGPTRLQLEATASEPPAHRPPSWVTLAPAVSPTRGGAAVGLTGQF